MAMTVRERTKEVGTLKAIGFQRRTIAFLFLGEALIVACIGAAIGIGGAAVDLSVRYHLGTYIPFFSQFIPTGQTLLAAFTLSVLVGFDQRRLFSISGFRVNDRRSTAEH